MPPFPRAALVLLLTWLLGPLSAAAQPGPREWNHVRFAAESEVRVRTAWDGGARATVHLAVAGRQGRLELHDGPAVATDVATSEDLALVAMSEMSTGGSLHLALVEIPEEGAPTVRARRTARMGDRRFAPSAVVAAATPEGFTVLWQAQSFGPTGRGGARTMMGTLRTDGQWRSRPREVPVPWAIADAVWNGAGYHLALYFDGAQPNQTRLCMVTLSEAGQPEQHPWWESRPGLVDEVQMVRLGERIVAAYRGGPRGLELRSRDVHQVRTWGQEVEGHSDLGRIGANEEFVLRVRGDELDVVRREVSR